MRCSLRGAQDNGGSMRDLADLGAWLHARGTSHEILTPSSLPSPRFSLGGRELVSFSTNNYLALSGSDRLKARAHAAIDRYGVGNCESRLLGGNLDVYDALEARLAMLKHKPAALLFATGYLTNLGVLPTLVKANSLARLFGYQPRRNWKHAFFTDEFNHLSIREGIRASGVPAFAYSHLDLNDLEAKLRSSSANAKIIVTDGVFSQHGDVAPVPGLVALADRYDAALYIDDAHGTGVMGTTGAGTTEHFGVDSERIIQMGTLSKAYGCIGGFIATDKHIVDILTFGSSAYGFTSAIPPDQAAAVLEAMDAVIDEPWRRERLWANQRHFVARMTAAGFTLSATTTAIVPLTIGDEDRCEAIAAALRMEGMHVDAVVFPAIAKGEARLRFIMNAGHTEHEIDDVVVALHRCVQSISSTPLAAV
jgi:glycine C-acetyltransferase